MGKIRDVWASFDFEYGKLGFPISNIKTNKEGVEYQSYEGGIVYISTSGGFWIE
jgi:hypothetical protein